MPNRYARPPIIEAVISIQFADEIPVRSREKLKDRLKKDYPNVEDIAQHQFGFGPGHYVFSPPTIIGHKLLSTDLLNIIMITPKELIISRLSPYAGWEDLFGKGQQVWSIFMNVIGRKIVSRLGTRYINRIDIPSTNESEIDTTKYVRIGISVPNHQALEVYNVETVFPLKKKPFKAVMRTSTVKSPLIGYSSIMLDLDVYINEDISQDDADIWNVINSFRDLKDELFESCITDRTRELFNRAKN